MYKNQIAILRRLPFVESCLAALHIKLQYKAWHVTVSCNYATCLVSMTMWTLCCAGGAGPMARLKAAASMRQQQQQQSVQQTQEVKLLKHVPARLPPSQRAIADWLDAERAMYGPPASSSSSGAAAAQAAAGSGFVMDANTGRLVPLQASATQVTILFKVCCVCMNSGVTSMQVCMPGSDPSWVCTAAVRCCLQACRLHVSVQCNTAQHSTAQHSTAQHSTAHHSTPHHTTPHHSTAQYSVSV